MMTYNRSRAVVRRARKDYGERCIRLKWGKNNWRVATESAYYYDKLLAHNQLFGTPPSQRANW